MSLVRTLVRDFGSQKVPFYRKSKVTFNVHVFLRLYSCPTNYLFILQKVTFLYFESTFLLSRRYFLRIFGKTKQPGNNTFRHTIVNILTLKQIIFMAS